MTEKKILIIDDDQHLQLGLSARLRARGYRVSCAADAISAITVARKELPDLIILDLGLPAGDGFLVLERMRDLADLVAIPVIAVSYTHLDVYKRQGVYRDFFHAMVAYSKQRLMTTFFLSLIHI